MMNPFKAPEFKVLKREWDQRLKDSKFIDIETEDQFFKEKSTLPELHRRKHYRSGVKEISDSYWDWVCNSLYHGRFKSSRDRLIWTLYSEGKSCSQITLEIGLERSWISRKIRSIERKLRVQDYPVRSVLPYVRSK